MKVFYKPEEMPKFENVVVTIGSFDGVHGGHQKILERVSQLAQSIDSQSVVITFHPHPRLVVYPEDPSIKLLTTTEEKVELLKNYGVDVVLVMPFSQAFSEQTPESYIENFLVRYFKPAYIVVGYDHRFGVKRAGDMAFLRQFETKFGYQVIEIEKHVIDQIDVSSTKIRLAVEEGDITNANRLLHHPFLFTGEVVQGQQIGRTIGFPTANLAVTDKNKLIPPHGIYAVFVWIDDVRHRGMMYRGNRPVLKDHHNVTIEVNIFNFNQDIYGKKIKVELIKYLRPDKYFDSLEDLVVQLADDERESHEVLHIVENQLFARVAVVILNYNTPQYLRQFLPSVCASRYGNFEVFVADNGSTDDSIKTIQEFNLEGIPATYGIDRVKVLDLGKNFGFAEGYNVALAHPRLAPRTLENENGFDYYVLINSDVRVSQNWLQPMVELMESDKTIGAIQPKILSYTKKRKFEYAGAAGGWMDSLGYPLSRGRLFDTVEKDRKQYDDVAEIFWASGAAMMIRSKLYLNFGGFDADHWAHMEEIDLCWRMKRAGYKIMVQPNGVARHIGGGTLDYLNPKKVYLNFRNSLFTIFKNEKASKLLWLIPTRLVLDGVAGLMYLSKGQFKSIQAILRAHFSFYAAIPKLIEKRKKYAQIVDNQRIGVENRAGILRGSVVWAYYVGGKKTFAELFNGKNKNVVPIDDDEKED